MIPVVYILDPRYKNENARPARAFFIYSLYDE